MDRRPNGIILIAGATMAALVLTAAHPGAAQGIVYEDVRIAGKSIVSGTEGDEAVTVVLGGFRMTAGTRTISGRDGVVWVRTVETGRATRHHVTVYAEGEARYARGDGTLTAAPTLIVSLVQQGRITAEGPISQQPLKDFPQYARALEARKSPRTRPADEEPTAPEAPETRPEVEPRETPPAEEPTTEPAPPAKEKPEVVLPVRYRADRLTSRKVDGERITVARGNVYVSQGGPESALFIEMRSQAAVIHTEKTERPEGAPSPTEAEFGEETITGVYLEGDVVIARGERTLRGERAYFDFRTNRAYLPDAVFRTVQEQRNIPIYIRAELVRSLSRRELYFKNAKVTSSDLHSPSYHVGVSEAWVKDATERGPLGEPVSARVSHARMKHTTFNIRSVPLAYVPFWQGDLEQGHTALRTARVGSQGDFGFGVETEWHLFRLLGLVRPKGVRAIYELNWYEEGVLTGIKFRYRREVGPRRYTGYGRIFGLFGGGKDDDFGDRREDVAAPDTRGRALWRHKEYLPRDWEAQFEISYLCDRNFLERYWPVEFFAGKEQETLLYAKKQRDNWAFTALAKYRLNRFETQDEAAPDLGLYLVGEPLLKNLLTFFSESHAGLRRFRPDDSAPLDSSDMMCRFDTRQEIDLPIRIGPVNIVPYAVGRLTYWGDKPTGGEDFRPYAQVGARAAATLWRLYDVHSRLWNLNGLRHVITPRLAAFFSDTGGVSPDELFPLDPDVEEHLRRVNGFSVGIHQRLQTKRGPEGNRHVADWMKLDVVAGFYDNGRDLFPGDGRFYLYRPEYSLGRNHINLDYAWYIADSATLLADLNYDTDDGSIERAAAGLSVVRSPRLAYYAGMRTVRELDSAIGTFGVKYKINRKYSISAFEQYDFDFRGKRNLATNFAIIRKFERWYAGLVFTFDQSDEGNEFGVMVTIWPEGIPEVRIGGSTRSMLLKKSDMN